MDNSNAKSVYIQRFLGELSHSGTKYQIFEVCHVHSTTKIYHASKLPAFGKI